MRALMGMFVCPFRYVFVQQLRRKDEERGWCWWCGRKGTVGRYKGVEAGYWV